MTVTTKKVTLQCRHEAVYPAPFPKIRASVYCRRCRDYREVVALTDEYQIRCGQCPLSRRYGRDLDAASRAASRHVLKRHTHTVSILDGPTEVQRVSNMEGQGTLPYAAVLSKRAEEVKKHQASLRAFIERQK